MRGSSMQLEQDENMWIKAPSLIARNNVSSLAKAKENRNSQNTFSMICGTIFNNHMET